MQTVRILRDILGKDNPNKATSRGKIIKANKKGLQKAVPCVFKNCAVRLTLHAETVSAQAATPKQPCGTRSNCVVLLRSRPDTVNSVTLHKTLVSTLLTPSCFPRTKPPVPFSPTVADCRQQGTASSPLSTAITIIHYFYQTCNCLRLARFVAAGRGVSKQRRTQIAPAVKRRVWQQDIAERRCVMRRAHICNVAFRARVCFALRLKAHGTSRNGAHCRHCKYAVFLRLCLACVRCGRALR